MSSREKFATSLKDVFAVGRAPPPPPPSSRRPHASPSASAPPPPMRRPNVSTSDPPGATAGNETPPRAPDSLVPVRFTDLIDERPDPALSTRRAPRNAALVLGALVAGVALVLSAQIFVSRAHTTAATQPAPLARPPAPTTAHAAPPPQPATSTPAVEPAPVPSVAPSAVVTTTTEVVASAPDVVEPVTVAEPAPVATTPELPAASTDTSSEGTQPKPTPVRRKRKRPSSVAGYEPPTAEFPDYVK